VLQTLVSHNDDLRRLVDRGYAVGYGDGYLIVRDIPYLDGQGSLQGGAIVAKLVFQDRDHVSQDDHQVFFAGGHPHGLDLKPIPNLASREAILPLGDGFSDVVVQRRFSNKPVGTGRFADFFEKIESYANIIAGPAREKYQVTPLTFRVVEAVENSVFKFHDTLTSRAELGDLSRKFSDDVVAVIGLGGTGSYVLDFIVKTPVREVRGFDHDAFHVHNAFRSPGRLDEAELNLSKAAVYQGRYDSFRHGLHLKDQYVDSCCDELLDGVTFAFVCVDKGSARASIFDLLISKGIPFIDVGMGLQREDGRLSGLVRVTYFSVEDAAALREKELVSLADLPNDEYRTNIQLSELNALNAALAVAKFKQLRGFYASEAPAHLVVDVAKLKLIDGDGQPCG